MSTQVAVNSNNAVATHHAPANEAILKSDIVIPRVLLMQGLSEFVAQRKAQMGDMVRSSSVEVIGGPEKPISIIPLMHTNEWRMEEKIGNKFEFRGNEPRTAKNEDLPWDFKHNGADWKRTKVINVFALLPGDVEAESAEIKRAQDSGDMPDVAKVLMPVVVSFRSTGYNAGKAVVTHFAKAASMAQYGAKAHGYSLPLRCKEDKNDKGTYYVWDVGPSIKATKEQVAKAEEWLAIISSTKVKIDETGENSESGDVSHQF